MHIDHGLVMLDKEHCAGYIFVFDGAPYSPVGHVQVSREQADEHNRLLAEAEIIGLDQNCQVGQYGTFYFIKGKVQTWTSVLVSDQVRQAGKTITFTRNGKVYRGRLQKDADCFNFRRVS